MNVCRFAKARCRTRLCFLFGRSEAVAGVPVSLNPNLDRHSLPQAISATKS
ncbi:hypothetical conserved protein [Rhizobium etli CFN 42]|uniref:Uncharacterized protein n=2 Tax=Rhizobium etli TaxID=29449 RepID=Q9AG67_RHIET|nr:unknown [Rhizobium etli]ABC92764.1 hypothetical conserved protein [Rhizobium etli CFN 42]